MSLFLCDKCGVIENTALSSYWVKDVRDGGTGEALCSECDKGKWHGKFPREFMTDAEIAEKTDWSGFVMCERIRPTLAAYDERITAAREAREAAIIASHTSPYPDHIVKMPNGSRSQRKAKARAKIRWANRLVGGL